LRVLSCRTPDESMRIRSQSSCHHKHRTTCRDRDRACIQVSTVEVTSLVRQQETEKRGHILFCGKSRHLKFIASKLHPIRTSDVPAPFPEWNTYVRKWVEKQVPTHDVIEYRGRCILFSLVACFARYRDGSLLTQEMSCHEQVKQRH
jgi:hypothetical protein